MEAPPAITFRKATVEDYSFMNDGVWDVYRVEKHDLSLFSEKEETEKIMSAIEKQRVFIAEENNGKKYIAHLIIYAVRLGYLQYVFADQTPYGVTYGEWFNKFCWVDFVYVHPGNATFYSVIKQFRPKRKGCRQTFISTSRKTLQRKWHQGNYA